MAPDCRVCARNAITVCAMREINRKLGIVFLVLIAFICLYYAAVVKENDYMLKMCFVNNVAHTL